jgi:hypothetical protein
VRFRFLNDAAAARTALDECAALHPPAEVSGLVQGLSEEIDAALAVARRPRRPRQLRARRRRARSAPRPVAP